MIKSLLENDEYNHTASMYFSATDTSITSSSNTYKNLIGNQRGGVYQLDSVTFEENFSTYKNNSAL